MAHAAAYDFKFCSLIGQLFNSAKRGTVSTGWAKNGTVCVEHLNFVKY